MQKEKNKKILGLERNVFILGLTSFFNDFASEMIFSIFPAFFTSVLKSGAMALGVVEGLSDAAANFFKIFSGHLSDKLKKRKIFVIGGYSLSGLTRPFYTLISNTTEALGLRFIDRIGKGLRDAPRDSLISISVEKKDLARSFGYHRAMDTLGAILGPFVAFLILKNNPLNFNKVFLISFIVGLLAIGSLFFIKEIKKITTPEHLGKLKSNYFSKKFKFYILSIFLLSAGSLPLAILLLKTSDLGLILASIPLFYMIYNIFYTLASFMSGRISNLISEINTISLGYSILILGYLILGQAEKITFLLLGFIVLGIYTGLTDATQRSYLAQLTNEDKRGLSYGFLNGVTGIGSLISGILGGILWQKTNPEIAMISGGVLVILGLICLNISQRRLRD